MAELQRSEISFRRQGSSGLVWADKLTAGEVVLGQSKPSSEDQGDAKEPRGGSRPYRTVKMPSPTVDPPSPKVAGCGFCAMFGKPVQDHKPKPNKRR
ncbi:hypothetical protein L484_005841 [Morus notabilis]|uniref:MAPK kinase substrate protein n=1 Tax=Morus notabilis TaxID=981085 RepID=W9R146_9ROSA|nr:uncharacterized protein At1g15400 [Morus notabilis]EXB33942.1 hypothetical protein L484_005841 [Morus notabilis]